MVLIPHKNLSTGPIHEFFLPKKHVVTGSLHAQFVQVFQLPWVRLVGIITYLFFTVWRCKSRPKPRHRLIKLHMYFMRQWLDEIKLTMSH